MLNKTYEGSITRMLFMSAVAILIYVILTGCMNGNPVRSELGIKRIDCDRIRLVLLNALAVANPDYRISWDYAWQSPKCAGRDSGSDFQIPVGLTPRSLTTPFKSFADPVLAGEISQDFFGQVKVPFIGEWKMSRIIKSLGRGGAAEEGENVDLLAADIGKDINVQAVVELKSPLLEEDVEKIWSRPDVFFFSSAGERNPMGWDWEFPGLSCDTRGFDFCQGDKSATAAFRQWVSLLRPEDAPVLREFGIDYRELQQRAGSGRIYGFVMHNLLSQVARLAEHPQVRSVKVVDVAADD
ncbi:hypothetical protein [Streptosporangium sp. NPDC001681]|uniref:hypothetical protein n=1 Tax=Streptosporangium sp. NPDC001681 TaxID=3154395 RepID=UPI003319C688